MQHRLHLPLSGILLATILVLGYAPPTRLLAADPSTQPAPVDGLALWMNGQKDQAVDAFIACDWSNGGFIAKDPLLGLTELQFMDQANTDPSLRRKLGDKEDALVDYFDGVLNRGDELLKAGKTDDARHAYTKVKECGQWLASRIDRIRLLVILGQQIVKGADGRLFKAQTKPSETRPAN